MKTPRWLVTFALVMLMPSIAGCAAGATRTTDPTPAVYVPAGYLCPPNLPELLRIPDEAARLDAVARTALPLRDRWLLDGQTMAWLMKQAAQARRPAEGAP